MKSLDFYQLKSYCDWLTQNLAGARLQDVWTDGQRVVLELYQKEEFYLVADLHPQEPQLVFLTELPKIPKKPKPVTLFLNSHAKNLYVKNFSVGVETGRVVFLELFSKNHLCKVEFRLIPKSVNMLVFAVDKMVAWEKPKDLPASKNEEGSEDFLATTDWVLQYAVAWAKPQKNQLISSGVDPAKKIQEEIRKKESTILKIQAELAKHDEIQYQKLGELLKYSDEVPSELMAFYDSKKTVAENRERAFQKAKDIVRKRQGTQARLQALQDEILHLKKKIEDQDFQIKVSVANQILQKSDSSARKKVLKSGFEVVIGKTGKDNLAILRQSRAWDYWFHLKDYPGAHAILFRNKNQKVPDSALEEVATWIIQESLGKKIETQDLKFDVIIAECRFVRPVKGAQGLVTYQNQRNFTFRVKAG